MTERSSAYRRFQASKDLTYERWHDGEGYDLKALAEMTDDERRHAEADLLRDTKDWRDIEALAAIASETAKARVREILANGPLKLRIAAAHALTGDHTLERAREDAVIAILETGDLNDGFVRALDMAAEVKSPRIIDALLRCTLRPTSVLAVNAAGLVYYLFGKASEPFEWEKRPLFLRFGEGGEKQREAFRDMCMTCGIDPARYLKT